MLRASSPQPWRLLEYGPHAVLVELDSVADVTRAGALLRRFPGVGDVVPAERTVLVVRRSRPVEHEEVDRWLRQGWEGQIGTATDTATSDPAIEIDVVYDGADLEAVSRSTGLSVGEVIHRHSQATYVAAFCGFTPGFAYLIGLDPSLVLPRRETPRTSVPAGSVAIGAAYSAVYPSASPGGWHLLGRTSTPVWDPDRVPPALIAPGTTVRFHPTHERDR